MNDQQEVQRLLNSKLAELKAKNPSYSMRAFALKIGLSPGATTEILKGERRVSRKLVERIVDRLNLPPSERTNLLEMFPLRPLRGKKTGSTAN